MLSLNFCPLFCEDKDTRIWKAQAQFELDWSLESERAFGDVLREMRRRRNLSQEALALEAGVERNYVSLLELGKNSASIRIVFKICAVLDILPSEFLKEVENRMRSSVSDVTDSNAA